MGGRSQTVHEQVPLRVVVVEHRQAVRGSICDLLHRMGHRAWGAAGYQDALAAASLGCDLVLADASLPPTGGLKVLDALRERYPHALCVLMSGGELGALQRDGLWEASVPFVDKPITQDALRRVISRARPQRVGA